MSATVPERIDEFWERAKDREEALAAEDGTEAPDQPRISAIIAVLAEEVAAIGKRIDDARPMNRI